MTQVSLLYLFLKSWNWFVVSWKHSTVLDKKGNYISCCVDHNQPVPGGIYRFVGWWSFVLDVQPEYGFCLQGSPACYRVIHRCRILFSEKWIGSQVGSCAFKYNYIMVYFQVVSTFTKSMVHSFSCKYSDFACLWFYSNTGRSAFDVYSYLPDHLEKIS